MSAVIEIKSAIKIFSVRRPPHHPRSITALQDINLVVERGQAVGLIGLNGSGKSTLLRLVAGTLRPTRGRVSVRENDVVLVELGAGFHEDLNLEENIRIWGALVGKRDTLVQRTADILEFAQLTELAEVPFKILSHGMKMRLALTTAVFSKPAVLLFDEALAVGDEQFYAKCLEALEALHRNGTTMVFASHHLGAIERICDKAVLLDAGKQIIVGAPSEVIAQYHRRLQ